MRWYKTTEKENNCSDLTKENRFCSNMTISEY